MYDYRGKHSSPIPSSSTGSRQYKARHGRKDPRKKWIWIIIAILIAAALAYPFTLGRSLRVVTGEIQSDDYPNKIGHLRVVYVSDIHYGFFFNDSSRRSLINTINDLKPDLVFFGGDYGTDTASAISFFRKLPTLHVRYKAFGVLGDTDKTDNADLEVLLGVMKEKNVIPLVNEVQSIPFIVSRKEGNGTQSEEEFRIYIAGADDSSTGDPDVQKLAASVAAEDFVIFLAHDPSILSEAQAVPDKNGKLGWFDLALFGHTHGGQIAGLSSFLNIAPNVDPRYLTGLHSENRVHILVSNGVGTSVVPARLFCPAQIHCYELSSK